MRRLAIIIGTSLTFLFALEINSYAQMIYGCQQKKDGQLRIVSDPGACRPSEISISFNATGPQGPAGPAGGAVSQSSQGGLNVYDAQGNPLGKLAGISYGYISIYIPSLSKFITLSPLTGDVDPGVTWAQVYYSDKECLSQPYVDLSIRYEIFKLGSDYLMSDDSAAPDSLEFAYYKPTDYSTGCFPRNSSPVNAVPAKNVMPFTMPVSLPLRAGN